MSKKIAEIRLSPGEVGYYDDYSRIYLNTYRTNADIFEDTDTRQIRKSIKSGRIRLISGSLDVKIEKQPELPKEEKVVEQPKVEPVIEIKQEEIKLEEIAPVEELVEVKVEEVKPETKEVEASKPKRRSRKKSAQ